MKFQKINKLKPGDKVAILSPSFAAPAKWPHIYELALKRLRDIFQLDPVEFPTTKKIGASGDERSKDLIDSFQDKSIKAIISSLGGDDQVTYIKRLPAQPFIENPKPFFGFSDNTHFENFLWLNGIPSYYGASLFTQFGLEGAMDDFTIRFLKHTFFDEGSFELVASENRNDIGFDWNDPTNVSKTRVYEKNEGWRWDGSSSAEGISWGGCLESIDELLRHDITIPSLEDFENIVLFTETSEEVPSADYVFRVYRALGERGILKRIKGIIVGRPKTQEFNAPKTLIERKAHSAAQREAILEAVRRYNPIVSVIQNFDIGHTNPQIALPNGRNIKINAEQKKIYADF